MIEKLLCIESSTIYYHLFLEKVYGLKDLKEEGICYVSKEDAVLDLSKIDNKIRNESNVILKYQSLIDYMNFSSN